MGSRLAAGSRRWRWQLAAQCCPLPPTRLRRGHGRLRAGALAKPIRRRIAVPVRAGETKSIRAEYGTIINPGIRKAPHAVVAVLGSRLKPRAVVFKGHHGFRKSQIISAAPDGMLPRGLLAHVTRSRYRRGRTTVALRHASIYEVAPNVTFDIPLAVRDAAAAAAFRCSPASGIDPWRKIRNPRLSGSWITTKVLGVDVTTGARLRLSLTAEAGVVLKTSAGGSCSLSTPPIRLQGAIGPVPVYGSIKGELRAGVTAGADFSASGSVDVDAGGETNGLPPIMRPVIAVRSPSFRLDGTQVAEANAGIGIAGEIGVGAAGLANLHLSVDNALKFVAKPGSCTWDLDLGAFSAGGKIGRWTVTTPKTPPVFHRNLWSTPCAAAGGPPPTGDGGRTPGPGLTGTIVIGAGMAGVNLGDSQDQVRATWGEPYQVDPAPESGTSWIYGDPPTNAIFWDARVGSLQTQSPGLKTDKGIGPGSAFADLEREYPDAQCFAQPSSGERTCSIATPYGNGTAITAFMDSGHTGRVQLVLIQVH